MDQELSSRDRLPTASRYESLVKIASGGMGTVYIGRVRGAVGFRRLVAIKRAHAHLLEQPTFTRMLIEEARLSALIHHANVVATHDVEELDGELFLVMDYIEGASLAQIIRRSEAQPDALPPPVVMRIVLDICAGLAAAHDLKNDDGKPLGLVHRDVTPQNILVGVDGVARLTDFGVAKCLHADSNATATEGLKGKVAYMAPEYIEHGKVDQRSDIFSLGIVLWEALTRERLFRGASEVEVIRFVLSKPIAPPSSIAATLGTSLDAPVLGALARDPASRIPTAHELAAAIDAAAQRAGGIASHSVVGEQVRKLVGDTLEKRRAAIKERDEQPATPSSSRMKPLAVVPREEEGTLSIPFVSAFGEPSNVATSDASAPLAPRPAIPRTRRLLAAAALVTLVAGVLAVFAFVSPRRTPPREAPRAESAIENPPVSSPAPSANLDPPPTIASPPTTRSAFHGSDPHPLAVPAAPSPSAAAKRRVVAPRPRPTADPNPY